MAVSKILTELASIFSTPSYSSRIPAATQEKISANGFGTAGKYTPNEYNEIYGQLLNMVAKIQNFGFEYEGVDFEKYNKGFISAGDAILDNFIDLADVGTIPKLINAAGDNSGATTVDPYKIKWANVKTAYYVGTYDLQYQVSTRLVEVEKAFLSDSGITNFVAKCRSVLPESLKYDRYLIVRNMLADSAIYKVSKDFAVAAVDDSEPIFNETQANTIISVIHDYADSMRYNTTAYNKLGVHSATKSGNMVLFINRGIYNALKTAMKNVYHNEIDFGVDHIEMLPDFGEKAATSGQFACILDDLGIYLWDTLQPYSWDIWNGSGLYWNTFLSYQGKIGYALHRNAVRFTLSEKA